MAIDGVFTHFLVQEVKEIIIDGRINKIYQPQPLEVIFSIWKNGKTYTLLLSSSLNASRFQLLNKKYDNPEQPYNFCMLLRKYIERGIIVDLIQIDNDRAVKFVISSFNEMGDEKNYHLYLEMIGRSANLILTDEDDKIIDAIRKLMIEENSTNDRIIIPKAQYQIPLKQGTLNPFLADSIDDINKLEGCSKPLLERFKQVGSVKTVMASKLIPIIYHKEPNDIFYCFDLGLPFPSTSYLDLSSMLEAYYANTVKVTNLDYNHLSKILKKEIQKQILKIDHLEADRAKAKGRLKDQELGMLLQANLYQIKKGDTQITVSNYYQANEPLTIPLNPQLEPSTNMTKYFTSYKKAMSTLKHVEEQLLNTNNEITYLDNILTSLSFSGKEDFNQIKEELSDGGYLKSKKGTSRTKRKITLLHHILKDGEIWVGKNNIQNDYLTHKLANSTDYWFHAKDIPGAHVVVRTTNLNEHLIRIASQYAALYSKAATSSSVPIDYTLVRYLKKIPKMKGCMVTYTNQKTIYIDPDESVLHQLLSE